MSIPDGFLIVYFIIILNFFFGKLKDFSCHAQTLLYKNMIARHILNILCVFFVIVIFTRYKPIAPHWLIIATFVMYLFFMMIIRCEYKFLIVFTACITVVFYLEATKNYNIKDLQEPEKTRTKEEYEKYQLILQVASVVIVFIGVIVYIGQHQREFGDKWSWKKFWIGIPKCSGKGSVSKDILTDVTDGVKKLVNK